MKHSTMESGAGSRWSLPLLFPIISYVLVFVLGILSWELFSFHDAVSTLQPPPPSIHHGSHTPKEDPHGHPDDGIPTRRMIFGRIPSLESLSRDTDKQWEDLLTDDGGFLWVRHNETASYPWGISMFHGLHCLALIRSALQRAVEGNLTLVPLSNQHGHARRTGTKEGEHAHSAHAEHAKDTEHMLHCFSYLAQSLQCSADGTIEKPTAFTFDADNRVVDFGTVNGIGIHHACRDPEPLWRAARESEAKPLVPWGWSRLETVYDL